MPISELRNHAETIPDKIAVRFYPAGDSYSYGALWASACCEAARLRASGIQTGDVVLIFAPQGIDAIVAFFAVMAIGAVPSFMPLPSEKQNPRHFWAQHKALFKHIGEGTIIAPTQALAEIMEAAADSAIKIVSLGNGGADIRSEVGERDRASCALLQHSSGTTGLKKGVALTFHQIDEQIERYARELQFTASSKIASWLPLYHDMGLIACFIMPIVKGVELILMDPFRWVLKPQMLFDCIEAHSATHVWLPNFAFNHLCRTAGRSKKTWDLSSMVSFINCSEVCKPASFDQFASTFGESSISSRKLSCCYAMAESVFAVTQSRIGAPARRIHIDAALSGTVGASIAGEQSKPLAILSCGTPLPDVSVQIVDGAGGRLEDSVIGEIEIKAPFLFSGYFGDAPRTAKSFRNGWYRTADIGFIVGGELYVCGRLDDIIHINGRNFSAVEIEAALSVISELVPGRSVALGIFNQITGSNDLHLLCEISAPPEDATNIKERISTVMYDTFNIGPARIALAKYGTVVKTTSGKIDRRSNAKFYVDGLFDLIG